LVFGGVFVALLVVELFLRFQHFTDRSIFFVFDHDRGVALKPFAEGWWNEEGGNYERINSQGFHDREHSLSKPPGTIRIAVLGDSYAEALHVPMESAFWAEAERKLQSCSGLSGRKVEVLNFGVSGYGTAQELITLRSRVWAYSPDIVLLAFTTGNDLNDNLKQLSSDPTRPYFVLKDGQLVLDRSTLDALENSRRFRLHHSAIFRPVDWLTQHLRTVQFLIYAARAFAASTKSQAKPQSVKVSNQSPTKDSSPGTKKPPAELGLDGGVYFEPSDENWKEAWRVTEALITQMNEETKSQGAKFYVVTLSSTVQVSPEPGHDAWIVKSWGLNNLFYPDYRILALGQREGFSVMNLAPMLEKYAQERKVYLHGSGKQLGSGHWNQEGHRAAGDMIADWMCTEFGR